MKKRKFSESSTQKPTPRGLPTMKRFRELMTGVDLWEMDKSPVVVVGRYVVHCLWYPVGGIMGN